MSLSIKYKGYDIEFVEHSEKWCCRDLDIEPREMLRQVKAAIDEVARDDRRVDIKALFADGGHAGWGGNAKLEEVTVTMLCAPMSTYRHRHQKTDITHCWIVRNGKREKVKIESLYPIEARAELQQWFKFEQEAQAAGKRAQEVFDKITKLDADALALAAREAKAKGKS